MTPSNDREKSLISRTPRPAVAYPASVTPPVVVAASARPHDAMPDYLAILRRGKWRILLCVAAGALLSLLISSRQRPMYQSYAALEIRTVNDRFLDTGAVTPTNPVGEFSIDPYVQSQAELLRNRVLVSRVVDRMKLWTHPGYPRDRDATIRTAIGNLEVRPVAQARVIRISFDSPDPHVAADFVNTLAEEFVRHTIEMRRNQAKTTTEWLAGQVAGLKKQLETSERELQEYARRSGLVYTDEKNSVAEENLHALQAELTRAKADRISKQALAGMAASSSPDALPDGLGGALHEYQVRLTELKRQRVELLTLLTPQSYKVQRVDAQISEIERAIQKELERAKDRTRSEYQAALQREQLLSSAYQAQWQRVSDETSKSVHYMTLVREVETTRALHAAMVQRAEQAAMTSGLPESNMGLLAPAIPSDAPYKPNLLLNAGLGLFGGLFLGITLIAFREFRDNSFRNPGELARTLHVAELGAIPAAQYDPKLRSRSFLWRKRTAVETVTRHHRQSITAESFRTSLASLFLSGSGTRKCSVVVITSAGAHEGKTTIVSNFGLALSEIGRRVLLINADLRQPRLHEIFGVDNEPGLSDVLTDQSFDLWSEPLDRFIRNTAYSNLSLMPGGTVYQNVAGLLHNDRLAALLARLRREFDVVLLDTPPALQIADARVIASVSDGVVLIVRAGETSRNSVQAVAERFLSDRTPILGTILNDWNPSAGDPDNSKLYLQMQRYYYQPRENSQQT